MADFLLFSHRKASSFTNSAYFDWKPRLTILRSAVRRSQSHRGYGPWIEWVFFVYILVSMHRCYFLSENCYVQHLYMYYTVKICIFWDRDGPGGEWLTFNKIHVEACVNMTKHLDRYLSQTESNYYDSMTACHIWTIIWFFLLVEYMCSGTWAWWLRHIGYRRPYSGSCGGNALPSGEQYVLYCSNQRPVQLLFVMLLYFLRVRCH